jgi:sugar-specific transcriptional regulator TrmB
LAKRLGLHRLDVYYDLKNLHQREMVEATLSRPMVYKAQPLRAILKRLEQANQDELREKKEALARLHSASERLTYAGPGRSDERGQTSADNDTIRIISGRKAIRAKWLDILKAAKREVLIVATERGPAQSIFLGFADALSAKVRHGVSVRVFTPVRGTRDQRIRRIRSRVRHLVASAPAGLCVIDRSTAMIIAGPTRAARASSERETALLTNSRSIGEILRTLFFVGWSTSPTFDDMTRTAGASGIVSNRSERRGTLK